MIKLKPAYFKSEALVLSESWIGCAAWVIRRSEVAGGMQSAEVLCALLRPQNANVRELGDAEITRRIPAAIDRPVMYLRTNVLIDVDYFGTARLFASVDGQVAPVNERIAQMLDLFALHGAGPVDDQRTFGTSQCRSVLVATNGDTDTNGDGIVYALVMPMQLDRARADDLERCARTVLPARPSDGAPVNE